MSYKYEVSRTATFPIKITCEACGHEYQQKTNITVEHTILDDIIPSGTKGRLNRKLEKLNHNDFSDLPALPCPECGYFQSWNYAGKQREVAESISTIAALVIAIPIFITVVKDNFFAAIILYGLSAGVLMFILRPILTAIMKAVYNPNGKRDISDKKINPTILS